MIRPLKQGTLDIPHVVIELIMPPRDVESRFRAIHGNVFHLSPRHYLFCVETFWHVPRDLEPMHPDGGDL
jgi:hypothetical protein